MVYCLHQNMGSCYGVALAAVGRCSAALSGGDTAALSALALAAEDGEGAGKAAGGRGLPMHPLLEELDQRAPERQLAAALRLLLAGGVSEDGTGPHHQEALPGGPAQGDVGAEAGVGVGAGPGPVLDDWFARDAALSAACQLALLVTSIDVVIVNHAEQSG